MNVIGSTFTPRVRKVLVAAHYAGVDVKNEDFFPRGAPEDAVKDFKKKNPNGKVPVLETPQGPIYESNAILRYIARVSKKLYGSSKYEEALVDQYLDWTGTLLEPSLFGYVAPILGAAPYDQQGNTQAQEKLHNTLQVLETRLNGNNYVVGNQVSIADIAIVSALIFLFKLIGDEAFRTKFPNVSNYVKTLASEEGFTKHNGRYIQCNTALQPYTGPLPQPEEAKKAELKAKAPQPKKEAAPAKKEKKKKDEDDDDDDEPKEKKVANPLDSLPPSSFNLFDFKTLFVNAPDKKEALNTFLQQFDPEGYSCWRMEYEKAEGEGQVTFLTANLMNGFLQRLENFRKYAFGVVGVYGDEPNLEIRGAWVWRGNEIPFEIKDHPSGEWYKFRKLDVKNNDADRKVLEDYWTSLNEDEDVVEGLKARTVKYFK